MKVNISAELALLFGQLHGLHVPSFQAPCFYSEFGTPG